MTVSFSYPAGQPNFTRAYIKGFIGSGGNLMDPIIDCLVLFHNATLDIGFDLVIDPRFCPPTSNTYSLDFVFVSSGSHFRVFGVETDVTVPRSEERRVGKECRSRWSPYH